MSGVWAEGPTYAIKQVNQRYRTQAISNDEGGGIISNYTVFANVDGNGFNPIITGANISIAANAGNVFNNVFTEVVDLSSIVAISSVEIRIALGDNSVATGKANFIQGIQLTGAVIIPEPATASLGLLSVAGLMLRRRRLA